MKKIAWVPPPIHSRPFRSALQYYVEPHANIKHTHSFFTSPSFFFNNVPQCRSFVNHDEQRSPIQEEREKKNSAPNVKAPQLNKQRGRATEWPAPLWHHASVGFWGWGRILCYYFFFFNFGVGFTLKSIPDIKAWYELRGNPTLFFFTIFILPAIVFFSADSWWLIRYLLKMQWPGLLPHP